MSLSDWYPIITYIGAAISFITVGIKIGKTLQTIDHVVQDNKEIRKELKEINTRIEKEHGKDQKEHNIRLEAILEKLVDKA